LATGAEVYLPSFPTWAENKFIVTNLDEVVDEFSSCSENAFVEGYPFCR